jgi:hypothetical protein
MGRDRPTDPGHFPPNAHDSSVYKRLTARQGQCNVHPSSTHHALTWPTITTNEQNRASSHPLIDETPPKHYSQRPGGPYKAHRGTARPTSRDIGDRITHSHDDANTTQQDASTVDAIHQHSETSTAPKHQHGNRSSNAAEPPRPEGTIPAGIQRNKIIAMPYHQNPLTTDNYCH